MPRASASSTSSSEPPRRAGWRGVGLGCALALATLIAPLLAARETLVGAGVSNFGPLAYLAIGGRLDAWLAARSRADAALPGVVFGDSVFAGRALSGLRGEFPGALAADLSRRGVAADVLDLSYNGLSALQFYSLVGRVAAGAPCFAVIEVNRRTFAADWRANPALRFPQFASGLSMRQVARARAALAASGVDPVAPLVFRAQAATGTLFLLDGLRLFGTEQLNALGLRVNEALGLPTHSTPDSVRAHLALTPERAREWYAQDFVANPSAALLRALADELRAAGVVTLFVVAPARLARLAQFGVSADELDQRMELLRAFLDVPPAAWLDPSALFQPADFRDALHLWPAPAERMAAVASERLTALLAVAPRTDGPCSPRRPLG